MIKRILAVALSLWVAQIQCFAAIATATVWEVRPTTGGGTTFGNDTNGGAFAPLAHSGSAQTADLAINATTATLVSSASHAFVAGDVMKYFKTTGGTGITLGGYQILSLYVFSGTYTSGGSITGTTGQTCSLSSFNGAGSGATATVALTGTNTIAGSTALTITANGTGYTSGPTSATLGSGTATCSGTATIVTVMGAVVDHAVGTVGSTGGGWTLYPGVDRSQQAVAWLDFGSVSATCTTASTITFNSGYTPTNADLDNYMQVPPGISGIASGFYQLIAESATTWGVTGAATLCTTPGTAFAAGTGSVNTKMGGSLASFGGLTGYVLGNYGWFKATGTMSLGATALSVSNGSVSNTNLPFRFAGYTTVRGDGGQVTIQPSSAGITLFTVSGSAYELSNFNLDGTGSNSIGTGISNTGVNNKFINITVNTFTVAGISGTGTDFGVTSSHFLNGQSGCTAAISVTGTGGPGLFRDNTFNANSCTHLAVSGTGSPFVFDHNLFYGSAVTCVEFGSAGRSLIFSNTLDGCSTAILANGTASPIISEVKNNLISNSTTGLEMATSAGWPAAGAFDGNCYYNNTTNRTNSDDSGSQNPENVYPHINTLDQYLSTSPYVDDTHASGNFAIKSPGTGYQVGTPGSLPGVSQIGYMSCGALTPQAATGTNSAVSFVQ